MGLREEIRTGLRNLGVKRVKRAIPSLEHMGHSNYCGCFVGMAMGWEGLPAGGRLSEYASRFNQRVHEVTRKVPGLRAISTTHLYGNSSQWVPHETNITHGQLLKEEVMIFLAEHGVAVEPSPKQECAV